MSKKPTEKQLAARNKFKKTGSLIFNFKDPFWNEKGEAKERTFKQYENKEIKEDEKSRKA